MGIEYKQRITVNFPTVEAAEKVKQQARAEGMSPSKWIIQRLEALDRVLMVGSFLLGDG